MHLGVTASIISAAFYTLALPPYDHAILAWVTLVPLLLVLPSRPATGRFLLGLLYGFGFALGVTSWAIRSVAAYFEVSWAVAVIVASTMYILYVGLYVGLFAVAAGALMRRSQAAMKLTAIPALWVLYEYLRTYAFAGLPWDFLAHSQHKNLALIQIADLTGELGVSFIVVLVNVAIAEALRRLASLRSFEPLPALRRIAPLAIAAAAAVGAPVAYGRMRLAQFPPRAGTIELALVQPSIHRPRSPSRVDRARAILDYVRTTTGSMDGQVPHLIVWPEYALDVYPEADFASLRALGRIASRARAGLIFGAPRAETGSASAPRLHNAAYFITGRGAIEAFYDKIRLLPFAEYTPALASPFLPEREQDIFTAGKRPGVIDTGAAGRAGILICYEALFPRLARQAVRQGADYLVNISNDGWLGLGQSPAPRQHFAMLPFRAIENRVFVARAATTGISGLIDPAGRTSSMLPVESKGIAFGAVAPPVARPLALRWGDWFPLSAGLWAGLAVVLERIRGKGSHA